MAEDRFTLFGFDSPEQVRARIGRTGIEQGIALANVPRGRGRVALAGSLGQMLGGLMGITPEQKLAKKRNEAQQNAFKRSDGKPIEYYRYLAQNLNDLGDSSGAIQALEKYKEAASDAALLNMKAEQFRISEKRIDERSKLQADKLILLRDQLDLKAEIDRKNTQIKSLLADSSVSMNDQKIIKLQNDIEASNTKLAQAAVKLRQADDRIDVLRSRAATAQFDADTRRMKLAVDERIAKLRASGATSKASSKALEKAFNDYSAITKQKSFLDFAKSLVADDPQLGSFFSKVDPDDMAAIIRGEVQQEIGNARLQGNVNFNYNEAVERAIRTAAAKYTGTGENIFGSERKELDIPRSESDFNVDEAQQLMNQLLNE